MYELRTNARAHALRTHDCAPRSHSIYGSLDCDNDVVLSFLLRARVHNEFNQVAKTVHAKAEIASIFDHAT